MLDGRMHQTTVRFSPDLWKSLEQECQRLGISAAQYLREAALARLAYMDGQGGNAEYMRALANAGAATSDRAYDRRTLEARVETTDSSEQGLAAAAVSAQREHVRRRAQEIRAQAVAVRRQRRRREK